MSTGAGAHGGGLRVIGSGSGQAPSKVVAAIFPGLNLDTGCEIPCTKGRRPQPVSG